MNMTFRVLLLLTAAVALFAPAAAFAELYAQAPFDAPSFKLTNQDNQPVSDADLKGKAWIVDFVFTRCGGPCPMMTQRMVKLARQINAPNVRFVSISVDPANDTPAVLKKYAQDQGATDPRFVFLTGDTAVVYDLAKSGFKVTALPATGKDPIQHAERFLLFDAKGGLRGIYHSGDDEKMTQIVADANTLAATATTADWIARFPAINASLNATSGVLLCLAMTFIQFRRVRTHAYLMIAAVITSAAFLACYLTFHTLKYQAGSATTLFPQSAIRPYYLAILLSHTILAVVIIPMIVMTLIRAYRRQWDKHRRIARPTFWIWLYVSVTGVVVYWMLYQLAPRIVAAQS